MDSLIRIYKNLPIIDGYDTKAQSIASNILKLCKENNFVNNRISSDNKTILMIATIKGHTDFVNKLLDIGANPFLVDIKGNNAFAWGS